MVQIADSWEECYDTSSETGQSQSPAPEDVQVAKVYLEVASDHGDLCHHLVETFVSIKRLGLRDVFGAWVSK